MKCKQQTVKKLKDHDRLLRATTSFLCDLECIFEMFHVVLPIIEKEDKIRKRKLSKFIQDIEKIRQDGEENAIKIEIKWRDIYEFINTARKMNRANKIFKENTIVSMISRYDKLIGDTF